MLGTRDELIQKLKTVRGELREARKEIDALNKQIASLKEKATVVDVQKMIPSTPIKPKGKKK